MPKVIPIIKTPKMADVSLGEVFIYPSPNATVYAMFFEAESHGSKVKDLLFFTVDDKFSASATINAANDHIDRGKPIGRFDCSPIIDISRSFPLCQHPLGSSWSDGDIVIAHDTQYLVVHYENSTMLLDLGTGKITRGIVGPVIGVAQHWDLLLPVERQSADFDYKILFSIGSARKSQQ